MKLAKSDIMIVTTLSLAIGISTTVIPYSFPTGILVLGYWFYNQKRGYNV